MTDEQAKMEASLHAMWTPEMFDRFESDVRWLLEASPDFRDRPEAREEIVAMLKKRAIESHAARKVTPR